MLVGNFCRLFLGFALRLVGACPWNYEDYDWDFWGLICLEYAPFWYFGSFIVDQFVIPYVLHLQWRDMTTTAKAGNSSSPRKHRKVQYED